GRPPPGSQEETISAPARDRSNSSAVVAFVTSTSGNRPRSAATASSGTRQASASVKRPRRSRRTRGAIRTLERRAVVVQKEPAQQFHRQGPLRQDPRVERGEIERRPFLHPHVGPQLSNLKRAHRADDVGGGEGGAKRF